MIRLTLLICLATLAGMNPLWADLAIVPLGRGSIEWRKDLEKSVAKAKREKKELALYFKTTWCKWCDKFDKTTLVDSSVVETFSGKVALKIDASKNRSLVRKYEVACYPTIILMDANGRIRTRIEGYKTPEELVPLLGESPRGL